MGRITMPLKNQIAIANRFQRAIRIDTDLGSIEAAKGFICPKSSADALLSMIRHINATKQGAFTWTGPYGSGKSSLVVALGSLLSPNEACRNIAIEALGRDVADEILETLPPKKNGWKILPIVGRRESPVQVIGEALCDFSLCPFEKSKKWSESALIDALISTANDLPESQGGLVVFIDEMGKFLEGSAHENTDIYFFQQLAEAASRSNKRLIVIGILHQAFGDYAHRLSREMRDEWSKIQGRFIDLPINVAGEEQIDLLSRAIVSKNAPKDIAPLAQKISAIVHANKRGASPTLASLLINCWPLHPTVACLLGPISRRRFGQNQRSLFGFLNSAEPYAFQDFLTHAMGNDLYTLVDLWDYLRVNLEPSILASPDGHRWSLAVEVIERCESQTENELHLAILKTIALVDLFKSNSGLVANLELLEECFPKHSKATLSNTTNELKSWSFVIFKKHISAFSIYAGSDFDIENAVAKAREEIKVIDFLELKKLAGLQPILAKRHYHSTGTLRWFDVDLIPLAEAVQAAANFKPDHGTIGQFLLAVATENENNDIAEKLCDQASQQCIDWDIVIGLSKHSWTIRDFSLEILALQKVFNESSDLGGDSVARREVRARLVTHQGQLETELNRAFDKALWFRKGIPPEELSRKGLSVLTSALADSRFAQSPKVHNELLNRIKPSSNAVAGQNALLKRMVLNEGERRLGIEGFPAEGGLFSAILETTKLYNNDLGVFVTPGQQGEDSSNLLPIWQAAAKCLKDNSDRTVTVSEIYDIWRVPPYGVRDGLMPVLIVAYILSDRSNLAFYRDGIFQSRLRDLDIEILVKDATAIQLRCINLSEVSKKLLSGMAETVRLLDAENILKHLEPIDVARGLVAIFDKVHPWAHRTMHLSKDAIRIRNLFKKANDPNKFLFNDIPGLLNEDVDLNNAATINQAVELVYSGLKELKEAYQGELNRLREMMLAELQVPNLSPQVLAELRERAENVKQLSGDFRLEAFVVRLADFSGTVADMEGLASLATNKPPKMWLDNDVDRAKVEITALAQKFIRSESFARVKGREDKRQSLSVVVGLNGRPTPVHCDFDVMDSDKNEINALVAKIEKSVDEGSINKKNIILAALAELSARYIESSNEENNKLKKAVS
jgi:hypothetical protein